MVTDAQTRLAHWIASQGVWTYSGVVSLIEKNSLFVKHIKAVAEEMNEGFSGESIKRAYVFARIASENGYDFARMFVTYDRRGYADDLKAKIVEVSADLKAKGANTPEKREQFETEYATFMQSRIEKCVKSSPYYTEWLEKQEEMKIASAFMAQNETTDYEAFKDSYKKEA